MLPIRRCPARALEFTRSRNRAGKFIRRVSITVVDNGRLYLNIIRNGIHTTITGGIQIVIILPIQVQNNHVRSGRINEALIIRTIALNRHGGSVCI